jgi:hypothetical protein
MPITVEFYIVAMLALIIGLNLTFFRDRFRERLFINIGIVAVLSNSI